MKFKEPTEQLLEMLHNEIVDGADVGIILEHVESACAATSTCHRPGTDAQKRYEAIAHEIGEALHVVASIQEHDESRV